MADGPDRTASSAQAHFLCTPEALLERGPGLVFDVLHHGRPARAFALRFDGQVVAYLNQCVHVPTELDWQPGEFLDQAREFIICAVHGASYEPHSGRCAGGPCGRGRLIALHIEERDAAVCWYPSRDIRPVVSPAPGTPSAAGP